MWYKTPVYWTVLIAWYVFASVATLVAFWVDKRRAAAGQWRVPERTLHVLELLGGWPGAFLAMKVVRHKNRKASYWLVTGLIAAAHAAAWAWWAWSTWNSAT